MEWKENKNHLGKEQRLERITRKKLPNAKISLNNNNKENFKVVEKQPTPQPLKIEPEADVTIEGDNLTEDTDNLTVEEIVETEIDLTKQQSEEEVLEDAQTRNAAMNLAAKTGIDIEDALAIITQAMEEAEGDIETPEDDVAQDLSETDGETGHFDSQEAETGQNDSQEPEDSEPASNGRCPITGHFLKGNKLNTGGLQVNPQNRIQPYPKGSKRPKAKKMLKKLLQLNVNVSNNKLFKDLKEMFPTAFEDDNEEMNLRVLLEMKQIVLAFSKQGNISQAAINAIKERVDGKVTIKTKNETKIETKTGQDTFLHLFQQGDVPPEVE